MRLLLLRRFASSKKWPSSVIWTSTDPERWMYCVYLKSGFPHEYITSTLLGKFDAASISRTKSNLRKMAFW
jgi:hypothetical protein